MIESEKSSSSTHKTVNDKKSNTDDVKKSMMSESERLLAYEKGNDEGLTGGKNDDPHFISFETEEKILAKQEEALEELKDLENDMKIQAGLYPCSSCEFLDPIESLTVTLCCGLCTRSFSRYGGIREFWIVSAPGNKTSHETFLKLNAITQNKGLSKNYKFHIPELKIGTMDELMTLLDNLNDGDRLAEETLQRLSACMTKVIGSEDGAMKHLLVNHMDLATYLTRFTWNTDKYPLDQSLETTFASLLEIVQQTAYDVKVRDDEVSYIISIFEKIKRDREANLLTRPLDKLVKKKNFLSGSEFLTTLLVVVAKENTHNWHEKYETLTEWVVPQSSKKLFSDESHSLFSVVVIKKYAEQFESAAREQKFVVRYYDISNKKDEGLEDEYMKKLKVVKKAIFGTAYRWIKAKFSECFVAWIHAKALRVFTESALRYGIPINFQATLLIPVESKKAKLAIDRLYEKLEGDHAPGIFKEEIPGALNQYGVSYYLPYVLVTINTDFLGSKDE